MPKKSNPDAALSLAVAMAEGTKIADWARSRGVSVRSGYRLASKPGVKAKAASLRKEMLDTAVGTLSRIANSAVFTLWDLLSVERPDSIRLNAARTILASLIDIRGHTEMAERMAEIEEHLAAVTPRQRGGNQ
jgi:hypothetical protein